MELAPSVAQTVVDQVIRRLGHNVNIMDADGVIIASGDPSRIGAIHEAARRALERNTPVAVTADEAAGLAGTQAGVNVPIVIRGVTQGVVGVTGDPERVEAAAASVLLTVELMLAQEASQEEWQWRQRARTQLIEDLATGRIPADDWDRRAEIVGCQLPAPYLVLAVRLDGSPPPIQVRRQLDVGASGVLVALDVDDTLWVIAADGEHTAARARLVAARRFLATSGIGGPLIDAGVADDLAALADTVHRVRLARSAALHRDVRLAELELPVLLARIDPRVRASSTERLLGALDDDLRATLVAFFAADMVVARAAVALVVHRNTLLHRLERITRLTGRDPRRFSDAAALYVALLSETADS